MSSSNLPPQDHSDFSRVAWWGVNGNEKDMKLMAYYGEWCDVCLYNQQLFVRGRGGRSLTTKSTTNWQPLTEKDPSILFFHLFGQPGRNGSSVVVVCKKEIYQITKHYKNTLLSSNYLQNNEELLSASFRDGHQDGSDNVSCCFVSNLGVARSVGPGKQSGHLKIDVKLKELLTDDEFAR
jgi:hypothetical protein